MRVVVVLLVLASPAGAGPVPPPPEVTREFLCGEWDYAYGGTAGVLVLSPGGEFAARMESGALWWGRWESPTPGDVRLLEWVTTDGGGVPHTTGPTGYVFAGADASAYRSTRVVRFRGGSAGGGGSVAVVLTRR